MARIFLSFSLLLLFSFLFSGAIAQVPEEIKPKDLLKRFEILEHVGTTAHCEFFRVSLSSRGWDEASPIPSTAGTEFTLVFSSERPSAEEFAAMSARARVFQLMTKKDSLEVKVSDGGVFTMPTSGYVYLCLHPAGLDQRLSRYD